MFSFANSGQVLESVSVYASHFYGSMLCNLYSGGVGQVYRSWNTGVKLAWDIPRMTNKLIKNLRQSPLRELRILANLVGRDTNSVTGRDFSNFMESSPPHSEQILKLGKESEVSFPD